MNAKVRMWLPTMIAWVLLAPGVQADITSGLVGHWTFNGDFTDSSGNGNHGQPKGDAAVVTDPEHGQVAEFDGTGDYIEIPHSESLNITGNQITLASWAYYDDVAGNPEILIAKVYQETTHANPYFSYGLHLLSNGQPRFWLRLGTASRNVPGTVGQLASQQWYHVAGVYDGSQMTLYLNGQAVATGNYTGNITGYNTVLRLGTNGGLTEPMDGKIDDVRIYNRALSAEDIAEAMVGRPREQASSPVPSDGALHEATWASLSWRPGAYAVSHDVYVGTSFDSVNTGAPETFRVNQTATSFFVGLGMPGDPYPGGLVAGTTYYWRIDEVNNADPNSPWRGEVWSFTVPPKTAYNPNPADGAEFVALNTVLTWTGGFGSKVHTVYIGESYEQVDSASGGTLIGTPSYNPGPLAREKVLYWRVDEFDGVETHKGNVWSFTTPGAAGNPQPGNRAADAPMTPTLSWTAADNATSHQVYFSMDKEAVRNATTASAEYKGNKAKGSESYDPGKLDWATAYYWRVDAVYNTGTIKGLVWSFTTADFISVDNFESYNDIDPPDPASNRVFDSWLDGFGTTTNGALVGNDLPPYAEQTIVHGGNQAMIYRYDNNLKFSEAILTLTGAARDWTREGVGELSLWFRGVAANGAERMYVVLNGAAVVYHPEPTATQRTAWTEWVIPLQQFAGQGVNLSNVTSVTIGFGTRGDTTMVGGSGRMYFDDLRLYRPANVP